MIIIVLALGLFTSPVADAHVWRDFFSTFCERYIVSEDPYQFETLSTPDLMQQYRRVAFRVSVRRFERSDKRTLRVMGNDLRQRLVIGDSLSTEIEELLEDNCQFENEESR